MSARLSPRRTRCPGRHRSGTSAIEFSLLAPIWVLMTLMMIDFGEALYLKLKLASALGVAAQYAFLDAQLVTASAVPSFLVNIQKVTTTAASLTKAPVVTVLFNNASDATNAANFYCVSGHSPVIYTSTGSSSSNCGGSIMSGKYISISVVGSMSTFFPADPIFGSSVSVLDTAVVRFQ